MKCKFCGAQMDNDDRVCPECGEINTPKTKKEEKQKEYVSPWKIVAATAVLMLLLGLLLVVMLNSITGRNWPFDLFPKETTGSSLTVTVPGVTEASVGTAEDLGMTIEGITDITLYTGDDAAAAQAADEVIAELGDYKLTNGLLQAFYWMEFSNFVVDASENGYDLVTAYNLDITKPLADQKVVGYDVTWEQFFLHNGLSTWWRYACVNALADTAGFQISDEDKASLESVPAQLEADAAEEGFESADAMIRDRLGAACDLDDYVAYMELTARGDLYYSEYQKTYTPTEEEVKEFFQLNADYYSYYGITEETGKLAAVRHVLLVPEGATSDETTGYITATDEQWTAGEQAAQALLDAWVAAGATEEGFAEMANEHSTDPGSNTAGGLYEDVYTGQMVDSFDAWVFDEARKTGDYGIVRSEFGYHLMYFVSMSEKDAWYEYAYQDAISYGYGFNQELAAFAQSVEYTPALDKVVLSDISQEPVETDSTEPTGTESAETTAEPTE